MLLLEAKIMPCQSSEVTHVGCITNDFYGINTALAQPSLTLKPLRRTDNMCG
jgi:hypothetical protein